KMGFELDIHWIHRGGENPVDFINRYAGRIRLLHLKDYRIAQMQLPEDGKFDMAAFGAQFNNLVQFAEVGEGNLPIKECIEAGLACGSEYFLIEQDDTYGRDQFESLRISRDNLIKLGYKDWFEL
ncbi:MAG: sugar phosphate isomerase/epimerase, partial [Clostridiales bacterium]|nr:sugar phosphate isomerase/epimerase [Candidatus Blautia equi]